MVPGFSLVTIESRSCQHGQASCASSALSRRPAIALQLHSARKPDLPVAGGHSRSAYRMLWPMLPSTTTQTSRRRSSIGERRWCSAMVRMDAVCAGPHECTHSISTPTGPACSATRGKGKPHEQLEGRASRRLDGSRGGSKIPLGSTPRGNVVQVNFRCARVGDVQDAGVGPHIAVTGASLNGVSSSTTQVGPTLEKAPTSVGPILMIRSRKRWYSRQVFRLMPQPSPRRTMSNSVTVMVSQHASAHFGRP